MQPPARTALGVGAALLVAAGAGCTRAAHARFEETRPPALMIEVLPRAAEVTLDGHPLGAGSRTVAVARDDAEAHVLGFGAPGFVSEVRGLEGGAAGARVGVALRPEGWAGPPLELDEPVGLAAAAAELLARGREADAADYAARAAALDPLLAPAHRALGDARAALGDPAGAASSLGEYLRLAPGASDAEDVAGRLQAARAAAGEARAGR